MAKTLVKAKIRQLSNVPVFNFTGKFTYQYLKLKELINNHNNTYPLPNIRSKSTTTIQKIIQSSILYFQLEFQTSNENFRRDYCHQNITNSFSSKS